MDETRLKTPPERQVVVISPMPAVHNPTTAGGVLLSRIVASHLSSGAEVVVLAPFLMSNAAELERSEPLADTHLLGRPRDRRGFSRAMLTIVHRALPLLTRWSSSLPSLPLVMDLLLSSDLRRLLRDADVIDLQWEEYGRLAGIARRLSPSAVITCMFHDVNVQRAQRAQSTAPLDRARRARRAVERARRAERRIGERVDVAFVLSEKDRDLLHSSAPTAPAVVVSPPLADETTPLMTGSERPLTVGFVSYLRRHENRDAAIRLATRIWPTIRSAVPGSRLLIVGGGLEEEPASQIAGTPGMEITGFVDDLEKAYARIGVAVSPLDRGAGVKFKVVEPIIRGIPTITTSVGAEGIPAELITAIADGDDRIAEAAIDALRGLDSSAAADERARRAREIYGVAGFSASYQSAVSDTLGRRRDAADADAAAVSADGEELRSVRRVAVVTPWDPSSARSWSGVIVPMIAALRAEFDVVDLITVPTDTALIDRVLARVLGARRRTHLPAWSRPTARRRSDGVARQLAELPPDVPVVALAATPELLSVPPTRRIVQVTDSSFSALASSYPAFERLWSGSRRAALTIESAVAARTTAFLVASGWSRQQLIDDVGVPPHRLEVAHFGPAISPSAAPERGRARDALRLLFIASDWVRKGGDKAVAVVEELRSRGADASLTVVGSAPPGLPSSVRVTGRLDASALSDEYRTHNLLIEPSRASAGGVVVTDALHHGLPVLATSVGGLDDLVQDDETGWLVPPGSTAVEIADVIASRVMPADLDAFSDRAMAWAQDHASWTAWSAHVRAEVER